MQVNKNEKISQLAAHKRTKGATVPLMMKEFSRNKNGRKQAIGCHKLGRKGVLVTSASKMKF